MINKSKMAKNIRIKRIEVYLRETTFQAIFKKFGFGSKSQEGFEFSQISQLRQLLSNQRAKILYTIKQKSPSSIYQLSKLLKRDFKSVKKDILLLKDFGLISLIPTSKGKRKQLKPEINLDKLEITINLS